MSNNRYLTMYPPKTDFHEEVIEYISDKYPMLSEIHIKGGNDYSFTLRNGYWYEIGDGILKDIEQKFDGKVNCFIDEDEDTGENFLYTFVKNVVNNS